MVKISSAGLSLIGCIVGINDAASSAAYIVMAAPRPWRVRQSGSWKDPDDRYWRGTWKLRNNKLLKQIEEVATKANALFGIVNGDLAESGKADQWRSLQDIYGKMKLPLYYGLGDRDYRDNVNSCRNVCPFNMVSSVNKLEDGYEKKLLNFRRDRWRPNDVLTPGSLAYSWDSSVILDGHNITSHFVQLHLSPDYQARLFNHDETKRIDIRPSFSWLWEDLYLARKRKVDYIFVNLHAKDEFLNRTDGWTQRRYASTLAEFKVDAVFAGDEAYPSTDIAREGLYQNIPVYRTGALIYGHFAKLEVFKDGFQVTNYVYDGAVKGTVGELRPPKGQPVWCKMEGQPGAIGDFYTRNLIRPEIPYYNLVAWNTDRALDANSKQQVYTTKFSSDNEHQRWVIEPIDKSVPPYATPYKIIHQKTGKALDGNKNGDIYLREWHGKDWQRWHLHKLSDAFIHWISEATQRSLDGNTAGKVYGTWGPRNFDNRNQMWRLIDPSGQWLKVQYFRAQTNESWKQPFPYLESNKYWRYLGAHRGDAAPPCIGW